jgi:xanthine/uracil permease
LQEWQWVFAVYAVVALVGLFLIGLATEGMAGLLERAVIRKGGSLRPWYVKATMPPSDWGTGQLWIWKSRQAADEFARRRLRILVCRNTWFLTALLTLVSVVGICVVRKPAWFSHAILLALVGFLVTALFLWLWVSANEGWHKAVRDASAIGAP